MKDRERTQFSALLVDSKDGEWGENEHSVGLREAIVIRGTDFQHLDDPNYECPRRWIPDHVVEKKRLRPGDIVLETAGGTSTKPTGRSALLKSSFFVKQAGLPVLCASFCRHLRLATDKYSARFVYYMLQALHRSGYMGVFNIQHTGVSRFQYTDFKGHTELEIPALSVQRRIAAILSSYDELIENNKRRIALLEKLAEEIYREWFVRFRFPAHQTARFAKGLPTEWSIKRVKQVVARGTFGRIYRESELASTGSVVVIDQSRADCLGFHEGEAEHGATPGSPVILFGDHTCKMVLMTRPFSLAENVIPFQPTPANSPYFLFHLVKESVSTTEYKRHWTDLMSRDVLIPGEDLQRAFEGVVRPCHEQIKALEQGVRISAETRDLLLPRLLSGKLSVENLDIRFPPGMAEEIEAERGGGRGGFTGSADGAIASA